MKPPVRAGGGRRTERYRGARRKRTRLPFAGVGKPERPRNPSAYNTPGSIEPPGEGARDEATLPGRRQAVLDPPQGTGRKWRAFGPPDMFSRAARPVGPPREFCWRPGPRQRPAASRRLCAQHGCDREVKVLRGSWSQRPQANRKASAREGALKEAGSETASRRTETGYEAAPTRASGQTTAKPSRPKGSDVDPAAVRRRPRLLPGEISPHA